MSLKPSCILFRSSRSFFRRQQLTFWRRSISITSQCLRKHKVLDDEPRRIANQKSYELDVLESIGAPDSRRPNISDDNIHTSLEQFLKTVNRRIENLLYTSAQDQIAGVTLTDSEFEDVVLEFRDIVMANLMARMEDGKYKEAPPRIPTPEELFNAHVHSGIRGLDPLLLTYFKTYYFSSGHPLLKQVDYTKAAAAAADMRNPGEWYPGARNMRRKIIMHVGPTNSGKTYQALRKLEAANTGWYGGPLRLLAHEIFNRMNAKGIKCNLRTGEEIRIVDVNAPLTSSTIEMFSETTTYDVAVIDEIQMLSDPQRGFAWTAALLGLKAKEIHLCGEEAAVPLVSEIAKQLGEEVEVNKYERLSPLRTSERPLVIRNLLPGDCVIGFSRRQIFDLKKKIEQHRIKCAVVYGGLPPETRSMQAALFNDPKSGYDVIVASDAIGMGLNLNIKRVIFSTLEKNHAGTLVELSPPQIKQIAGRAGRFRVGGVSPDSTDTGGVVTAMTDSDMEILRKGMEAPVEPLPHAVLWPPWNVFEKFTQQFPVGTPLCTMIAQYVDIYKSAPHFRLIQSEPQMILAQAIDALPNIDPESRYSITFAPISHKTEDEVKSFVRFAEVVSNGRPVTITSPFLNLPLHLIDEKGGPTTPDQLSLRSLEILHKLITCYCWLSVRWPALFTNYPLAQEYKSRTEVLIHESLGKIGPRMPPHSRIPWKNGRRSEGRQEQLRG